MDNIEKPFNNVNVLDPHHRIIAVRNAAAGDLSNEKIKTCYICKNNCWPHETITFVTFERVLGRVLSNGRNENTTTKPAGAQSFETRTPKRRAKHSQCRR